MWWIFSICGSNVSSVQKTFCLLLAWLFSLLHLFLSLYLKFLLFAHPASCIFPSDSWLFSHDFLYSCLFCMFLDIPVRWALPKHCFFHFLCCWFFKSSDYFFKTQRISLYGLTAFLLVSSHQQTLLRELCKSLQFGIIYLKVLPVGIWAPMPVGSHQVRLLGSCHCWPASKESPVGFCSFRPVNRQGTWNLMGSHGGASQMLLDLLGCNASLNTAVNSFQDS